MLKKLLLLAALMNLSAGAMSAIVLESYVVNYGDVVQFTIEFDQGYTYDDDYNFSRCSAPDACPRITSYSAILPDGSHLIETDPNGYFTLELAIQVNSDTDVAVTHFVSSAQTCGDSYVECYFNDYYVYIDLGSIWWDSTASTLTYYAASEVPVPAAAWLFGSALLGLGVIKRRKA